MTAPVTHLEEIHSHSVHVLRLDLLHPVTGGNKCFKLKYNLSAALAAPHRTVCTFGGAYSNHIAATAQACREAGVRSIAIIRGEDNAENPTLSFARQEGMELVFADRVTYSKKADKLFLEDLYRRYGPFFLVPEGGNNEEGIAGAAEIVPANADFDYIVCACGTGTTYAGILSAVAARTIVVGVSVLKGENLLPAAVMDHARVRGIKVGGDEQLLEKNINNHCILSAYSFSGYARFDKHLVDFKRGFEERNKIALDHVYTVKLFYAVYDLCRKGKLPAGSRVLIIHSGGIQGNAGFEKRYESRLRH